MEKNIAKRKSSGKLKVENSNFNIEVINEQILISKDIARLISFYIFNIPFKQLTAQAVELCEYGWNDPWNKPEALNKRMKDAFYNLDYLQLNANVDDMIDELKNANMGSDFPIDINSERICINDCAGNQYLSILRHIRNCFCHGRFQIIQRKRHPDVFVFEDVNSNKNVNGRMIITRKTLVAWMEIIKGGP